jgi:hypothetical protein
MSCMFDLMSMISRTGLFNLEAAMAAAAAT